MKEPKPPTGDVPGWIHLLVDENGIEPSGVLYDSQDDVRAAAAEHPGYEPFQVPITVHFDRIAPVPPAPGPEKTEASS